MTYRPEVRRVARLLTVDPERVAYLESVSDEDLLAFGKAVDDAAVQASEAGSVGIGRLARAIPVGTAAKVAEKVGSPLLVARLAYFNDPQWATKMAEKLSPDLVASAVTILDPQRTAQLIGGLSEEAQLAVLAVLVQRAEWVALGGLFGALSEDRVKQWAAALTPAQLAEVRVMIPAHRLEDVEKAIV